MRLLRDYRLYRFKVTINPEIVHRDYAGDEVSRQRELSTHDVNVIAPNYDGEEVAKLFIRNKFKFSDLQEIVFVEKLEIHGATWMEGA